ncbi:MAG: hypothetical protein Kow0098_19020 [Ignavibacteriaceae bacterium]
MKKIILLAVLFCLTGIIESFSLPRFALRTGGMCIGCHVNPTGGLMRNRGGWSFGKNVLPMLSPRSEETTLSNYIGDNISYGFDFRGQYLVKMTDSTTRSDFQRMAASVYTAVNIGEDINIFSRYDFLNDIWEAYAVAQILPNGGYIKGGSFTPNYGIRLDDHTAYTRGGDLGLLFQTGQRQGLIYDPYYVEAGVEAGIYFSDMALLTASVGNPGRSLFTADPTYTANLMIMPPISDEISLFFGGSAAIFKQQTLGPNFKPVFPEVTMYGGYLGFRAGDFSLLGEYDMANDYITADSVANAIMIEAAYRIVKGLEAVLRYDRFDPNDKVDNDDLSRLIIGFEIFPYSFIEIRPQYRMQIEEPKIDNDSFVMQFHLYY